MVMNATIQLKSCTRCGGDMHLTGDHYGPFRRCLQCGHQVDTGVPRAHTAMEYLLYLGKAHRLRPFTAGLRWDGNKTSPRLFCPMPAPKVPIDKKTACSLEMKAMHETSILASQVDNRYTGRITTRPVVRYECPREHVIHVTKHWIGWLEE